MKKAKFTCMIAAALIMGTMLAMPVMAEETAASPCITQGEAVPNETAESVPEGEGETEAEEPETEEEVQGPGMEILKAEKAAEAEKAEAAETEPTEDEAKTEAAAESETPEAEAAAQPSYSEEDLDILAHAICGEAQGCPDEEQRYVGSVILNRKNHSAYPNTIKGVVFQKGQYACTWDGNYYRQPTDANYRNAKWLLENGSVLPGNVVYQASFKQGRGIYLQTRWHKYCYR